MESFFLVCFGVGAGFTVISFLLGELLGHIGGDAPDFDVDGHFDADIDADIPDAAGVSPLKPSVLACFLTVFGGAGLLLLRRFDWRISAAFAAGLGLLAAYGLFKFVIIPLHRHQNTSAVEKQSLIGHNAVVSETIRQGGYGKITYHAFGNTLSAPAKSEDGAVIGKNEAVEIVVIEKNTYYVRKKQ